ncbi:uncharacterized protein GLRG_02638 [Colletotrichum graminicola M1.001]|uniref:C2H2-type domain-containing protein n=1 Tax=Colletotrichum graminicola (strain M1.001 / M2 / FGSC 10212) TaxID=645133 RepID=E3Q7I0_COLGM|nr:uncharacterized protein GLRG_02638 [Colletotrichum graminicola M1.001]EFQ26818.1 hypothetical protein GLRG_02638 [Colletotrichum graminicola M1.001]
MDNRDGNEPLAPPLLTISSLAHSCRTAFAKLCQDLLLPSNEYHGLEPEATDQAGRFNVWALNIGALQRPQSSSSLDSRLKKAERMKNNVVSGLQRLEVALKRANEIALGNIPNRTTSPATAEEIIKYSVGTVVGSIDERDRGFTTEINELFSNIQSCITYLFTLSTLLRRSHPRGRTSQQGPQSSQSDPGPLVTNAKDKFPKLKQYPWLAERIGQRTARQMDYIRYRQSHRTKLARVDAAPIQDVLAERATTKATSFHDTIAAPDSIKQPASGSSREESIYTVATSFAQTAVGETHSGRIIPQLTDMWLDGRQLGYGEPVECPYCRTIQTIKDRYHWKHHVYRDLQTYVCSFEHCSEGPFQTSHEWFQHEIDKHRRQWKCVLCHARCNSASALESHFDSRHPSVASATQRKVMLKACEKPLNHFDTDSCPLCDNWLPSSETGGNSNKFRSHLAKHYQDLACEAIPLAIEGLEIKAADDTDDDSAPSDDDDHSTTEPQGQPSSSVKPAPVVIEGSDEDETKPVRSEYVRRGETRIPAHMIDKRALIDLGYSCRIRANTAIVNNHGKSLDHDSLDKLLKLSEEYKQSEPEVAATSTSANFTIEEASEFNPMNQDYEDAIEPPGSSSPASARSRSPAPALQVLSSSEDSDEKWDDDTEAELIRRRQERLRMRKLRGGIGMRTISEHSESDHEDGTAVDPDTVGTSSRRLRRRVGDRLGFRFQDLPPEGAETESELDLPWPWERSDPDEDLMPSTPEKTHTIPLPASGSMRASPSSDTNGEDSVTRPQAQMGNPMQRQMAGGQNMNTQAMNNNNAITNQVKIQGQAMYNKHIENLAAKWGGAVENIPPEQMEAKNQILSVLAQRRAHQVVQQQQLRWSTREVDLPRDELPTPPVPPSQTEHAETLMNAAAYMQGSRKASSAHPGSERR